MNKKISTILTIHNKDFLIERVCYGLIENLSEKAESSVLEPPDVGSLTSIVTLAL